MQFIILVSLTVFTCERAVEIMTEIAGDIKLPLAIVRRAIKDLKNAGLIVTKQRYRKKGGKSSLLFNIYILINKIHNSKKHKH